MEAIMAFSRGSKILLWIGIAGVGLEVLAYIIDKLKIDLDPMTGIIFIAGFILIPISIFGSIIKFFYEEPLEVILENPNTGNLKGFDIEGDGFSINGALMALGIPLFLNKLYMLGGILAAMFLASLGSYMSLGTDSKVTIIYILIYVSTALFFIRYGNRIIVKHCLKNGWEFYEADSDITKLAKVRLGISTDLPSHVTTRKELLKYKMGGTGVGFDTKIRCNRCEHIGKPTRALDEDTDEEVLVCAFCQSNDWIKVEE
jgi:hypothetical protein